MVVVDFVSVVVFEIVTTSRCSSVCSCVEVCRSDSARSSTRSCVDEREVLRVDAHAQSRTAATIAK